MSLLLDALKKAAEGKSRQEKEAAREGKDSQSTTNKSDPSLTETKGAHSKILLEESIDEWSLEEAEVETPAQAPADQQLSSSIAQAEDTAEETVSLTQNMRRQSSQYQGSPVKAAHVFRGKENSAGNNKQKLMLIVLMVIVSGVVAGLYGYDYMLSKSDERLEKYRPIRSIPLPLETVQSSEEIKIENQVLSEQESYESTIIKAKPVPIAATNTSKPRPTTQAEVTKRPRFLIAKEVPVETVYDIVLSGYQAYQAGNYTAAKLAYQKAMLKEPDNRDALLGLATVAMIEKDYALAKDYYGKLIRLDPRDTYANAGMNNVLSMENNTANTINREAQLKNLLQQNENSHELHYSLGSLYSSQQQWPLAQYHFFAAYALNKSDADYSYNLAVSLDQLGQKQAAVSYYQTALLLSERQRAMFNVADVNDRMIVLQQELAK